MTDYINPTLPGYTRKALRMARRECLLEALSGDDYAKLAYACSRVQMKYFTGLMIYGYCEISGAQTVHDHRQVIRIFNRLKRLSLTPKWRKTLTSEFFQL